MKPTIAASTLACLALASSMPIRAQSAAPLPNFTHIYVIAMENREFTDVIGNASAPYVNSLAQRYALGTSYTGVTHPSLPNYMALTSGDTFFTDDCAGCVVPAANIADQIEASGRRWKAYMESMSAPCTATDEDLYSTHHNPFVHYTNIVTNAARCRSHVVPLTTLGSDLVAGTVPEFVWITPNLCSDMHDCPIATGDAWLSQVVPAILNTPASGNGHGIRARTIRCPWRARRCSRRCIPRDTRCVRPRTRRGTRSCVRRPARPSPRSEPRGRYGS